LGSVRRRQIRSSGGEEFVLALKGYTASEGEALANQIREDVEKQPLVTNDVVVPVTSSFGVAEADGESEETIYQLLHILVVYPFLQRHFVSELQLGGVKE
jgi:GGDEF domain-containing protein